MTVPVSFSRNFLVFIVFVTYICCLLASFVYVQLQTRLSWVPHNNFINISVTYIFSVNIPVLIFSEAPACLPRASLPSCNHVCAHPIHTWVEPERHAGPSWEEASPSRHVCCLHWKAKLNTQKDPASRCMHGCSPGCRWRCSSGTSWHKPCINWD